MTSKSEQSDIVALVEATPVLVLTDKEKFSTFYHAMKAECDAHVPDLSTEKGRKEIASLAYKVARTKTAIDDAGKKLNEEARARINAVDESRREIRAQLDSLKDEVRRPLTEWEAAEEERKQNAAREMQYIGELRHVGIDDTGEQIEARLKSAELFEIDVSLHGANSEAALNALAEAKEVLRNAFERVRREEAERAELARLREEAAERERLEAERLAQEAEKKRAEDAAKAEAERIERLQKEAEERAKLEAEAAARKEREEAERKHAEALAAEKRRAEEAEAAAQSERDRAAKAEADRKAEEEREAAAQRKREADRAHRSKLMTAAKEAIMEAGSVEEQAAKNIVLAIVGGSVPHITMNF